MKKVFILVLTLLSSSLLLYSQNVGINTTNPLSKLEVNGDALISGGGPLKLRNDGTDISKFLFENNSGIATHQLIHTGGTSNTLKFQAMPAALSDWVMDATGKIGIGTAAPVAKFHINNEASSPDAFRMDGPNVQMTLVTNNVIKGFFNLSGDDVRIGSVASNDFGRFVIRINGGDRMIIQPDGRVSIGTTAPGTGYMLSVKGKVISEEVRVQVSTAWPDYVFNENYKLLPIDELDKLLQQQKHLPGIPPASEIEKNGFDLGDMNKRLLEKTEELTLYIISLKKEINSLSERILKMESDN